MGLLLFAAFLTIVIETPFLAFVGYRSRQFIIVCVLINFVTNVSINLLLSGVVSALARGLLYPCEAAVVLIEWAVLRFFIGSTGRVRLLIFVFLANVLSYTVGVVIFGTL